MAEPAKPEPPTVVVQPPATLVQAGGRVAESIVSGLTGTPTLLLIVILNVALVLAAAYYLARQEQTRAQSVERIGDLLHLCIGETVPLAAFNTAVGARPKPEQEPPYH